MVDIDIKYKTPLVGKYNIGVYECPFCDHSIVDTMHSHIVGFSETSYGMMGIVECPKCFGKYYSHADEGRYGIFLWYVKDGRNIHYNSDGTRKQ